MPTLWGLICWKEAFSASTSLDVSMFRRCDLPPLDAGGNARRHFCATPAFSRCGAGSEAAQNAEFETDIDFQFQ
jgi:hypothetical protein